VRGCKQIFRCQSVDDNWDELNVHTIMPVGNGSMSGVITDDSETL
jgi:hypothetical protein